MSLWNDGFSQNTHEIIPRTSVLASSGSKTLFCTLKDTSDFENKSAFRNKRFLSSFSKTFSEDSKSQPPVQFQFIQVFGGGMKYE